MDIARKQNDCEVALTMAVLETVQADTVFPETRVWQYFPNMVPHCFPYTLLQQGWEMGNVVAERNMAELEMWILASRSQAVEESTN